MKRIGIIGLGNIGNGIATAIVDGSIPGAKLVAVLDQQETPFYASLQEKLTPPPTLYRRLDAFLAADMDLVVEAANPAVVRGSAKEILAAGKDFLMMSVGGLIDPGFLDELAEAATASGATVYVPAGAVTGQNVAAASMLAGLDEVVIESTKSIAGLREAPYIREKNIDLEGITEPTVIFRGNVFDAVRYFPQNVNIAASLALAGFGPEKTMVEIVADPGASRTLHNVRVKGAFGEMACRLELLPSPNKRSSYLAMLGAVAAVKKYCSPIKMGY